MRLPLETTLAGERARIVAFAALYRQGAIDLVFRPSGAANVGCFIWMERRYL
jgi:hypothetical protein